MTEHRNKDTTPPAVVPTLLDLYAPSPHFIAPPGFPIPQATSNNFQYQNWINYSTACALQQFYWNQLLASFVSHSTLAALVPHEAQVTNIKMEDFQQSSGGREPNQSHHQGTPPAAVVSAPLNLTIAVKSKVAMETKTTDSSLVTSGSAPVAVKTDDNHMIPTKESKDFICHQCNRRFGFKHVLKNHMRMHTGERPYECSVCQRKFARNHHLKTHMRVHTGEKPYECIDCDGKFAQYANLQRHFRKKHMEAGDSQEKVCEVCNKTFSDRMKLNRHVKKCHKPEVGLRLELAVNV